MQHAQEQQDNDSIRREHISVAAYFMAERRGFACGSELDDWVAAENAINAAAGSNEVVVENRRSDRPQGVIQPDNVYVWARRLKVPAEKLQALIQPQPSRRSA